MGSTKMIVSQFLIAFLKMLEFFTCLVNILLVV